MWNEKPPPNNPGFVERWFLRCQELVDKYEPDLLYFDNTELPLGQAGLDIAAHFYNANMKHHGGRLEAVLNSKGPDSRTHAGTMVLDIERGRADRHPAGGRGRPTPASATGTTAGPRSRSIATRRPTRWCKALIDIVSKNGNLLLSIPLRGDGTIDDDEQKLLARSCRVDAGERGGDLRHAAVHRFRRRRAGREGQQQF